ncbi:MULTISPECIES: DUF4747 family protein [Providencia]|nr:MULTISPECIES: DUF4747 family protein [Providencia]EJD6372890.1 DUF4747 family protein [Providencia rettgeri]MBG5893270.1 DUF4747 family protein [Providencia rettgeri]MBS0859701.1 DUF4747 family protein [Providencia rettgeri]MBS0872956.1 DUF4747 family protein [Providencia rettgeri]MBS0920750.1 DUF4747 family protein [Providencia rettgeri]
MARNKKLVYGALNITIHPHSPQKYVELFKDTFRLAKTVNLGGDVYAILKFFSKTAGSTSDTDPYEGEILKYMDISKDSDWYSIATNELATDEEKEKIVIPEHLKPNASRFSFVFLPEAHLLVYEARYNNKNLSHIQIEKFFNSLFSEDKIVDKYGVVNVTSLTAPDEVERMLSLQGIKKITMVTRRPNPDDIHNAEQEFKERLKRINAIEEEKTFKADRDSDITPDQELKVEALIASRNGKVTIKRQDHEGFSEELSSSDKPLKGYEIYDPNDTLPINVLLDKAKSIYDDFRQWLTK